MLCSGTEVFMAEPKRKFTREFKTEAVRLATSGDKPLAQVARELGILPNLLRNWKRQGEGREGQLAADVFPGHGRLPSQEEELHKLRREVAPGARLLKKNGPILCQGVAMKYAAIQAHRGQFSVALMCRVLGVSRSGFYGAPRRVLSARAKRDEELRSQLRVIHQASRRTYGSPRVHAELQAQGERCGRKRVARLMREAGLRVKVQRRFRPQTTDSKHSHRVADNVLARRFAVKEIERINQVWAGDITYVPTREVGQYLAVILDVASRKVVGWSMGRTLEASLASRALEMAVEARDPSGGLLHHSDRGVQYAAARLPRVAGPASVRTEHEPTSELLR